MRIRWSPALVAVCVLPVMSCGGSDELEPPSDSGGAGAGQIIQISANLGGALRFDVPELTAAPGKLTIEMANPTSVPHAVGIRNKDFDEVGETVGKGGVSKVSADLEAGVYRFYCPVGSHEEAGMIGVLRVR